MAPVLGLGCHTQPRDQGASRSQAKLPTAYGVVMPEERVPEVIPPALVAQADQLQANAAAKRQEIDALMSEAKADAVEQVEAGESPLKMDELEDLVQGMIWIENISKLEDLD